MNYCLQMDNCKLTLIQNFGVYSRNLLQAESVLNEFFINIEYNVSNRNRSIEQEMYATGKNTLQVPLKSPGHTDEFGIFYHFQCSHFTEHRYSCL